MSKIDNPNRNPLRVMLPDRRANNTFELGHTWKKGREGEITEVMTITVGMRPDQQTIGEVFARCSNKDNERATVLWHDIGILVSIALQHGATVQELSSAMHSEEVPIMGSIESVWGSPAGTLLAAMAEIEAEAMTADSAQALD